MATTAPAKKKSIRPAAKRAANRKPSRAGLHTRSKLLDSAERLFAEYGFEGASLRMIAEDAKLHVALCTYYFETKEKLLDEVIARRAVDLERERLASLVRIDPEAQTRSETVRLMIDAYVTPLISARFGMSPGWRAYVRLMAHVINDNRWTPLIRKHMDFCAMKYLERWRKLLPNAEEHSLLNAFSFMVATALYVCSYTNRFGQRQETLSQAEEVQRVVKRDLVNFVHAGFMAL